MPRTVEHIVECHRLARERISAGKRSWSRTVDIRSILNRYEDCENDKSKIAACANEIGAKLRAELPTSLMTWEREDTTIFELVQDMEGMKPTDYDDDPTYSLLEDFNGILDQIYDWADMNRVWLGI